MMKFLFILLIIAVMIFPFEAIAQNKSQNTYWASYFLNKKLSPRTGISFDTQVRFEDDFTYLKNILVRPGFAYYFDNFKSASLGYSIFLTLPNPTIITDKTRTENTVWEQFLINTKFKNKFLSTRVRLEQRFMQQNSNQVFAQRLRLQERLLIPLQNLKQEKFTRGLYTVLQDEVFFNLQNKSKLNTHFFDQNRAALSLGYRYNKEIDVEGGFMYNLIKNTNYHTNNYVCQIAVFTRFK